MPLDFWRTTPIKKCLYYIIYWTFDDEGKAYLSKPDNRQDIKLQSSNTKISTKVHQNSPNTEHESLGHFIAPSFTQSLATEKILSISQSFISNLQRSHLSRYEMRLAYFTILLPRLTYTFSIISY